MAITWNIKIHPIDVSRKEASIVAVRTDNTDSQNVLTETHTIISGILDTQEQKIAILNAIWQLHLDYQTKQNAIEAYIGDLETQAKTNLEGRES